MEGNDNPTLKDSPNITETKLQSFQNLPNYFKALTEIPFRLVDRVGARSMDQTELVDVKSQSQHEMKKTLSWWDLMWLGMGAVIGAGIFAFTGHEAKTVAGPAVVLSYVISGTSAMLSVFCYTELAVEIPVAGMLLHCFFLPSCLNYQILCFPCHMFGNKINRG